MIHHSGITKPGLQPDDVAMLTAVLRAWCQEKSCGIASPQAQHVARELVSWFECGIRDKHRLTGLMRHMHLDLKTLPAAANAPPLPAPQAKAVACHHG
ncbi:hypothetical protein ATY78_18140 [Rhizobium sp. R635]|uniref:hypothetical protein n=1 Tax=unclassified Rhizobium TaxID=2613769 RepID=UPI000B52B9E0|nr:hypothetical protein [Rhizobium sp. R635]OWV89816.1 hypothetical protein ATY78_18140 [Rhizobium sp. R635]